MNSLIVDLIGSAILIIAILIIVLLYYITILIKNQIKEENSPQRKNLLYSTVFWGVLLFIIFFYSIKPAIGLGLIKQDELANWQFAFSIASSTAITLLVMKIQRQESNSLK